MSLTDEERHAVADAWVRGVAGRFPVVVHVGHLSVTAAARLAAHAQKVGAAAIATCGPFFYPIRAIAQVVSYCRDVAAAAPALPFYYYHIPQLTHLSLSMVDLVDEAADRIPTFRGIKYTHNDLEEFARLVDHGGGVYDLAFGRDEILLQGLAAGAVSAIGSTFNFAAPHFERVRAAFARGDLRAARAHQASAAELIRILRKHGGLSAMKAAMAHAGIECGPVRPPLRSLDGAGVAALGRDLAAWGLAAKAA